jgi:hypothetical protein
LIFLPCSHIYVTFYLLDLAGVHWLDFFDELLEPFEGDEEAEAGTGASATPLPVLAADLPKNTHNLRKDFVLDGTHMNPSYLYLVEREINRLLLGKM